MMTVTLVGDCGATVAPHTHARQTQVTPLVGRVRPSGPVLRRPQPTIGRGRASKLNREPLRGRTVVVDPGHNGGNAAAPQIVNRLVPAGRGREKPCNTTGTETDAGYAEAAFNWDVGIRLEKLLRAQGARVVMTRNSNTGVGPCVNRRAAIGNRAQADAAVSIHADGGPPSGRGFQVIYAPDEGATAGSFTTTRRLAQDIHQALLASAILPVSSYDGHDGYSVRDDLAGLNLSTRPAVFVELGNMRNRVDAAIQSTAHMRQRLAQALARGLEHFLLSSG